ncbi:glutathione S-transferase [Pseudomonadota bacterium]
MFRLYQRDRNQFCRRIKALKPILYSFRRCPFAIRARMTLNYAALGVELREVLLRDKPPSMLIASPKGTVPILILPDGSVIDESIEVMRWALTRNDPDHWWREDMATEINTLVEENDLVFKRHLDHYKYADRYPAHPQEFYRDEAEKFLSQLEHRLVLKRYLMDDQLTFPDVAVFPFVRQFAFVDKTWFDQAPYPKLQAWLQSFLDSELFSAVMKKIPVWHETIND